RNSAYMILSVGRASITAERPRSSASGRSGRTVQSRSAGRASSWYEARRTRTVMNDDERFDEFVRSRAGALYRYAYLLAGDHHDADDLVQDALIRLRRAWPGVRQADPVGYTRTVIARLHVSRFRRRREYVLPTVIDSPVDEPGYQRAV